MHGNRSRRQRTHRPQRRRSRRRRGGFNVWLIILPIVLLAGGVAFWYARDAGIVNSTVGNIREPVQATREANQVETGRQETERQRGLETQRIEAERQTAAMELTVAKDIHRLVNDERKKHGVSSLTWDERLAPITYAHSTDMASGNYLAHVNRAGLDATERALKAGYDCRQGRYVGVGENIAIETADLPNIATDAVIGWMGSPGHRRNILDPTYRSSGVGAAWGTYRGFRAMYLTQVFC